MRSLFILCFLSSSWTSVAQEPLLTVKRALEIAAERHPRLLALQHSVLASHYHILSEAALSSPALRIEPELLSGGADNALLLEQPLELNGIRRARTGIARAEQAQAYYQSLAEGSSLLAQVQNAYFELAGTRKVRQQQEEILSLLTDIEERLRRQVELGARPGVDLTQVEIERLRQQQAVLQAQSAERQALARLNQWLLQNPEHPVELAPIPVTTEIIPTDRLRERPEILQEYAIRQRLLSTRSLERSKSNPDLFLQARWERFSSNTRPGLAVGLSLPLIDYGTRRNRLQELEQLIQAQSKRIQSAQQQVETEKSQAQERLRAIRDSLQLYESGIIEKARRLLEAQWKGYTLGQTDLLHFLEAQRAYKTVQLDYIHLQTACWLALTEYQRSAGAFLPICEVLFQESKFTPRRNQNE